MNYRLNSDSEEWEDNSEFGYALEIDALEMFDEGEAEMLDPELFEEMLDERSTVPPIRQRFFRSRRPAARRPIFRQRPKPPQPPRRRPGILPPVLFRQASIEPIVDIADSPVAVSDSPLDVADALADTADSTVDQSDSPPEADDSTATEYELSYGEFKPIAVESPGGRRIQNKTDPKPADVETLVGVGGKSIKLHRLAAAAWRALVKAARADGIAEPLLLLVSGYRSSEHQKKLWEAALKKYGSKEEARKWVAPPGGSAHQSGRAIDFHVGGKNSSANVANLRKLPAYKWLVANARRFGFYPYSAEPWHWEYNPPASSGELEFDPELYDELESWKEEEENSYFRFDELELDGQYEDEEADIYSEITAGKPSTASSTTAGIPPAALASFISPSIAAAPENALSIMKIICQFLNVPWQVGYTILEHEGGVRFFNHHDGVMQTTADARKTTIPLIPRPLKLALLGLPSTDKTADATLTSKLHTEFPRRLAVQIATGVQELSGNLKRFSGYVALAFIAYNAGPGWASYIATQGKSKNRPPKTSDAAWEGMCRAGATLLHKPPRSLQIGKGVWQCDKNLGKTGGWFRRFGVTDPKTNLQLIAYQYLRSIKTCINSKKPTVPCNAQSHKTRDAGSGPEVCDSTRLGALDKLFDSKKLGPAYQKAAGTGLAPIADDGLPLRVVNGGLVKIKN